jgi:hypothetical protein
MSKNTPLDPAVPAGSEDPKLGDDRIRALAAAVAELLNVDHYMGTKGGAGIGYNEDDAGEHKKITLRAASAPAVEAGKGYVYAKIVSEKAELFYKDEDGNEIQITSGGILNSCNLTGDQEVAGVKTFSDAAILAEGSELSSAAAPTDDAEIANKKYIDDEITAAIADTGFGTWASKSNNIAYKADTDGFVVAYDQGADNIICGFTDGSNPPTTRRTQNKGDAGSGVYPSSITMPVRSGDYWKVTGAEVVYWLPLT